MSAVLRKLNDEGLRRFADWIAEGADGPVPVSLLTNPETSEALPVAIVPVKHSFADRVEFGWYLKELLTPLDANVISRDAGLWSALALVWFDLVCPPSASGKRKPDKAYRYILSPDYRHYYRHLVRTPWQLVRDHGENARFLLVSSREAPHPLSVHGEILEQFGGRQSVLASRPIIAAAGRLYLDPVTRRPKRGTAGSLRGSARRFGAVLRQFDLTFEAEVMSHAELIAIFPHEFDVWKSSIDKEVRQTAVGRE